MKCPVCVNELKPTTVGGVTVDVCVGGCGGIWFDNFELQKFDEPHEFAHELLVNVSTQPGLTIDHAQKRKCPKCEDMIMMRHYFSTQRRLEVDECPQCGGIWLDAGELALIREEHQNGLEQKQAVEKYLKETAARGLGSLRAGNEKQAILARRIGNVFRFATPIRYQSRA